MHRLARAARAALDIILPRKARVVRVSSLSSENISVIPKTQTLCGIDITTLLDYRSGPVEDCIRALKYDGSAEAAALLADILAEYLSEELSHARRFWAREMFIVPVPLHRDRMRERGFNQVERIVQKLPAEMRSLAQRRILARTRETGQQTKLARAERLKNVAGAFSAENSCDLSRAFVFLIDDVATTGATLSEAARTLMSAGAEVHALALARA